MSFLLGLEGIGKRYGAVVALDGVDLELPAGGRTAIVGPSGSGKTTLLRLIAGFEAPDVGRVMLDGALLADGPVAVPPHRRGIGFVPQDGALFPHLSIERNIGFGLQRRMPGRDARIDALMELVELPRAMRKRRPHELSGGQQQRVALARALARQPKLMLLDEPFSALDAALRASTRKAVAELLDGAGISTILVTHDQVEALSFADRVAVLREGRLVQAGPSRELYLRPHDRDTARFLGEAILLPAQLGDGWIDCCLGRLPADTTGRRGAAEIMLRPEQVRLTAVAADLVAGGGDPAGCHGRVVAVEFGGAQCTVTVSLSDHPPAGAPHRPGEADSMLRLRSTSLELPPVGGTVRITVVGKPHIFA
jgi:iron(III) transport system ATP-binding protein